MNPSSRSKSYGDSILCVRKRGGRYRDEARAAFTHKNLTVEGVLVSYINMVEPQRRKDGSRATETNCCGTGAEAGTEMIICCGFNTERGEMKKLAQAEREVKSGANRGDTSVGERSSSQRNASWVGN